MTTTAPTVNGRVIGVAHYAGLINTHNDHIS
jgi:hypothetical protein